MVLGTYGITKAQIYPLTNDSTSPNQTKRFIVVKREDSEGSKITYGLQSVRSGRVLWEAPCAYQVTGSDDTWPRIRAQAAKVYWSKDGSYFLLDEDAYRYMGNAILGTLSEINHKITTHTFTLEDVQMKDVSEWRIQVDKGWITPTNISLRLIGNI